MIIKTVMLTLVCVAFTVLIYTAGTKKVFCKMNAKAGNVLEGGLFGLLSVLLLTLSHITASENTVIISIADAVSICAGFMLGIPAGMIAGVIGGIYGFCSVFWTGAGEYTQVAGMVSMVVAGLLSGLLRKYVFDNKKPTWAYGVVIALSVEILHILLIFITNLDHATTAYFAVRECALFMLIGNAATVGLVLFFINMIEVKKSRKHRKKTISFTFQRWLFLCIAIAFVMTDGFTSIIETNMSEKQIEALITTNLNDVYQDIRDVSDENLLEKAVLIKNEYLDGVEVDELAEKYNVKEVNIVDKNGIITKTNVPEYEGYDMASGKQSNEFLVLLDGDKTEFVQDYRQTSYDDATYRKYGAVVLEDGGFLQIGYDASQFRGDINDFVGKIAKNRHLGTEGLIVICDEDRNIVTEGRKNFGKNLDALVNLQDKKLTEGAVFETKFEGEIYYCSFRFVEGYFIIGIMSKEEAMFMTEVSDYISMLMELIIYAALFILIYFLIKRIILDNINKINTHLARITSGDLNVVVDVRSNDEFASLSNDINSTVETLKKYISEAEARIDAELEFARQVQSSSLPTVFPDRREFAICARMDPAKEVGGDFYDFYMLNDSNLIFLVADVSGKGIPAAMFMMRAKAILKALAESGLEPNEIFEKANANLCENNEAGMFVTAWMGILDLKTGLLKFANAGHNPPLVMRANGDFEYMKTRSGFFLAGMEGMKYRKNEICLSPGDKLFLYTDGVTEATDADNKLYGDERLKNYLNSMKGATPAELCEGVVKDIDKFVGKAPQFDDITMLAVDLKCLFGDTELSLIPNAASFDTLNDFAQKLTSRLEVVPRLANKINIIFDEIYANIVNYSGATLAKISYAIEGKKLYITFIDNGIYYDPLSAEAPDITLSADERKIGGLGIHMVKKMSENVEYERIDEKNILKITMSLE